MLAAFYNDRVCITAPGDDVAGAEGRTLFNHDRGFADVGADRLHLCLDGAPRVDLHCSGNRPLVVNDPAAIVNGSIPGNRSPVINRALIGQGNPIGDHKF